MKIQDIQLKDDRISLQKRCADEVFRRMDAKMKDSLMKAFTQVYEHNKT